MQLSDLIIPTYTQMLGSLRGLLDKADAHARAAGTSFEDLLQRRLAPDMFPLEPQIRFCCVQAGEVVHRPLGRTAPEVGGITSLADAQARITQAQAWLAAADTAALDASADAPVALELPNGMAFDLTGGTYVRDWALPQFHFHLVTAYAILRQAGVPLGKADYVPHMLAYLRR